MDIFNKKSKPAEARLNLARWYNKVEAFGDDGFSKVIETFENNNATIINYFQDRLTNASADTSALESEIDRLVYPLYGQTEDKIKIVERKE